MPRRPRPVVIPWSGIVYRATTYDVPLWANPNRRSGRWNLAGRGATQYFCLDAEAPYAEMLRAEELRTEGEAGMFRTTLWQARVEEGAIVDYGTFEKAEAADFPAEALVEDDHERCQAEAERLRSQGVGGVLSPSAALPGSVNLTLFGSRVESDWTADVQLSSLLPVQRLTEGRPPAGLAARTRFYGQPHPLLDEHRAAQKRRS
jgi:hypothetical protein